MEWVETTGRTVEEALDAALDELGVDVEDVEYQVMEEPKAGLFGRLRSEARVRARVRPTRPRAKEDRRRRKGRADEPPAGEPAGGGAGSASGGANPSPVEVTPDPAEEVATEAPAASKPARARPRSTTPRRAATPAPPAAGPETAAMPATAHDVDARHDLDAGPEPSEAVAEVADAAREFLGGLIDAFGLRATTAVRVIDDHTVEVEIVGPELGLLIGPKGQTLLAIQDLMRTVVHLELGDRPVRLMLEVAGYRRRRKVALESFARQVAAQVRESGERRYLEPMSAADRKIVHDTINDEDGVLTVSEGEEPHRYVVVLPSDADLS